MRVGEFTDKTMVTAEDLKKQQLLFENISDLKPQREPDNFNEGVGYLAEKLKAAEGFNLINVTEP